MANFNAYLERTIEGQRLICHNFFRLMPGDYTFLSFLSLSMNRFSHLHHASITRKARNDKERNRLIDVHPILGSKCHLFRALCPCARVAHSLNRGSSIYHPYPGFQTIQLDSPLHWPKVATPMDHGPGYSPCCSFISRLKTPMSKPDSLSCFPLAYVVSWRPASS